ncbi:MAG: hypothetical protein CME62_08275 [Halobacteriovoraceae bacterium]|nr:hypothetical protein [Halobacteriovoraceae bacterium]|tara:strand:+ start:2886 stop:3629 length:744 start_codon:yes stop_codon:yes gene_type:complete
MSLAAVSSFKEAYRQIFKDKVSFALALIPVLIGIVLFYFLGTTLFSNINDLGQFYIQKYLGDGSWGTVATWMINIILTILLYYIVNVAFVLVIAIIASPFNDILSQRIEKRMLGEKLPSFSESIKGSVTNLVKILLNEVRKIIMILGISFLAILIGLIPFLTPLSFFLSAIVISIEFIDYSWSRHDKSYRECKSDYRQHWFSYSFGGLFFMLLVSIPGLNILVPSYGTSYFTVLWVKNNERHSQITQ